ARARARAVAPASALGSDFVPVEKLLDKRIRKRGRGRITEYLVQFKTDDPRSRPLWMTAQSLPEK
ncbi:hypothetical protein E4U54_006139, partial [Claviceps lovelessii]